MDYSISDIVLCPTHVKERYCDETWYFAPACRDFHNLTLILSGEGTLMSEGRESPMLPGMLVYNHDGETYGFGTSKTDPMHLFGMNFYCYSAAVGSRGCETARVRRLPLRQISYPGNFELVHRLFKSLAAAYESRSPVGLLKCKAVFAEMVCEIIRDQTERADSRMPGIVAEAAGFISRNYKSRFTLGELAERYGVSKVYFGSCFKRITGKTFVEYVNDARLEAAADLILGGAPIQQAALQSGFSDPFYFSRVFRKARHVSPRQFGKSAINRF